MTKSFCDCCGVCISDGAKGRLPHGEWGNLPMANGRALQVAVLTKQMVADGKGVVAAEMCKGCCSRLQSVLEEAAAFIRESDIRPKPAEGAHDAP